MIRITTAQIASLFLQAIFFGFYLISCWFCALRLFRNVGNTGWKRRGEINWIVSSVAIFLFVNGCFNIALGLYRLIFAFVYYDGPLGAEGYFKAISSWVNVAKTISVNSQAAIGDTIIIYRCYVVYGRSWKVVLFPISLWLGCVAVAIRQTIIDVRLNTHAFVTSGELYPFIVTFWALVITQNILTTGLIVRKVWIVESGLNSGGLHTGSGIFSRRQSALSRVTMVIIESGLMITTVAFITFVLVVLKNTGLYVLSNASVVVVGIAFNLITIRTSRPATPAIHLGATTGSGIPMHTFTTPGHLETGNLQVYVTQNIANTADDDSGYGKYGRKAEK